MSKTKKQHTPTHMKNKNNNNKKTNTNTNSSRKKKKCKHTHTLVYESACTHTNAYACMPECTYACMHAHTHTHACTHTHTHEHTHTCPKTISELQKEYPTAECSSEQVSDAISITITAYLYQTQPLSAAGQAASQPATVM